MTLVNPVRLSVPSEATDELMNPIPTVGKLSTSIGTLLLGAGEFEHCTQYLGMLKFQVVLVLLTFKQLH
jgi:hypothetical protein